MCIDRAEWWRQIQRYNKLTFMRLRDHQNDRHLVDWTRGQKETRLHRLIKTQIGHARDFTWYRGQRENLCSYATNPPHFRVRELLLCDILITRAGDGRWPRYQAKSLACPGCARLPFSNSLVFPGIFSCYHHYSLCQQNDWLWEFLSLRGNYTPNQIWAGFVHNLKIINTLFEK